MAKFALGIFKLSFYKIMAIYVIFWAVLMGFSLYCCNGLYETPTPIKKLVKNTIFDEVWLREH